MSIFGSREPRTEPAFHTTVTGPVPTPHGLRGGPNHQEEPDSPVLVGGNHVS